MSEDGWLKNDLDACTKRVAELSMLGGHDASMISSLVTEVQQLRWQVKIANELAEVRGKLMNSMNKDCELLNSLRSNLNELLLGGDDED